MKKLSFKEWLAISESKRVKLRPDMEIMDTKKEDINIGDVVELGPETKLKGKKVTRIGKIIEKRFDTVVVQDLTRSDLRRLILPISNLHDKEDLKGRTLLPSEERDLLALGGKKLWVLLTPRQYKKFKSTYKPEKLPEIIPSSPSIEDRSSAFLRDMFKKEPQPEEPKELSFISKKPSSEPSPLRRFIRTSSPLDSLLRKRG